MQIIPKICISINRYCSLLHIDLRVVLCNMLFQFSPSSHGVFAKAAPVRFLVGVTVHMELEVGQFVEMLQADLTLPRLLSCVNERVVP